jgi:hypothetical protein
MNIKLENTLEKANNMKKDVKENGKSIQENAKDIDELEVRYLFIHLERYSLLVSLRGRS